MDTILNTSRQRLIPFTTISEGCFVILLSIFWGSGFFGYVFVLADKILHTGVFIRTVGKTLLCIFLAFGSFSYCKKKVRLGDFVFVFSLLLIYFTSSSSYLVPKLEYESFTKNFLWALPMFFVGISIDFEKTKKLLRILSLLSIVVGSYYYLIYIQAGTYTGSNEYSSDNMSASYGMLTNVLFMIWYSFENFKFKSFSSWLDLLSVLIGCFSILMMGTRGPVLCIVIFVLIYLVFIRNAKHRFLHFLFVVAICCFFVSVLDDFLLYMSSVGEQMGFSTRVFDSFLSDDSIFMEGSSGRNDFYLILINAMYDSPIWGYGVFGSYRFIRTYTHNIIAELLFSFGYVLGGVIIMYGLYFVVRAFRRNHSSEEKGFLFVLIGTGFLSLLFSSLFFITPAFYMFVGYGVQLAFRKNNSVK